MDHDRPESVVRATAESMVFSHGNFARFPQVAKKPFKNWLFDKNWKKNAQDGAWIVLKINTVKTHLGAKTNKKKKKKPF